MLALTDKVAREKIVRARTNLLVSNGFFGFLALQLILVECNDKVHPDVTTMAVDGKSMYYNTVFTHRITERECEGVVVHEIMHCAFKHFSRRGSRDPKLWNIAGDYSINLDIKDAGFVLPGTALSFKELITGKGPKKEIYLYDPQFKGKTVEQIYDKLVQHTRIINIVLPGASNDPGGCGGVLDAPGNSSEQSEIEEQWETSVRIAVETAKMNAGTLPASLRNLADALRRPKVTWRDKTHQFIDQSMSKEFTWSRIGRRSFSIGTLLPGVIADRLRQLIFIIDISGSISYELAREMGGEVGGALDEGTADEIIVLYADTKVQDVEYFYPGDLVKITKYSGGGTDFADSFRWVKDNAPDASAVIYLTDLQVTNFGEEPHCPVLWATYADESSYDRLAANVPFGKPIWVDHIHG